MMAWHYRSGLAILALLLFRLVWGFVGSSTARFASFVRGPRAILDHLRGRRGLALGHNPLGALNVLALLGAIAVQVGLGLFASDEDGLESGPLAHLIDVELSEEIAGLHESWFNVLAALIALHVAAILYYLLVRRKDLVSPMVTGLASAPPGTPAMRAGGPVPFLFAAAIAAAAVYALI